MEAKQTNPFLRADTLLGVCQALGEDFGFNPLWLRLPLASVILFNPTLAFGLYFALGAAVLLSRLVFRGKQVAVQAKLETVNSAAAEPGPTLQDTRELAEAA